MLKDEPDQNTLVSLIGSDISISAGLIKTANSPFFGIREKVRSGGAALMMLGLKSTSLTIAGIILRNSFSNVPNLERFWEDTMRTSIVCGWLATQLEIQGLNAEDAYTFALFRDCGIPVLLGRFKNYQMTLDKACKESERSFTEVEEAETQRNHALVGGMLAKSWYLPIETYLAISYHHDVTALSSDNSQLPLLSRRLIAIAQLAEQIELQQLGLSRNQEWQKLGKACMNLLDVDQDKLESFYAEAESILES